MEVQEIKNEGLVRSFKITIPAELIQQQVQKKIEELALDRSFQLAGFRPGKNRTSVIKMKHGKSIYDDVLNDQIENSAKDVLSKLTWWNHSGVTNLDRTPGKNISFDIEIELYPEINIPDFKSIKLQKPTVSITPEMVEEKIQQILDLYKHYEPKGSKAILAGNEEENLNQIETKENSSAKSKEVSKSKSAAGTKKKKSSNIIKADYQDKLLVSFTIEKIEDHTLEEYLKAHTSSIANEDDANNKDHTDNLMALRIEQHNANIIVVSNKKEKGEQNDNKKNQMNVFALGDELTAEFLNAEIDQIISIKGVVKEKFDEIEYGFLSSLKGKKIALKAKVLEISSLITPEVNEEFAKTTLNCKVEEFKDKVQEMLTNQIDTDVHALMVIRLFDQLETKLSYDVPPSLLKNEEKIVSQELERINNSVADSSLEEDKTNKSKLALRRIRIGMMLSKYAELHKIQPTEVETKQALMNEINKYPHLANEIIQYYNKNAEARNNLFAKIIENKAVKKIVDEEIVLENYESSIESINEELSQDY